MRYYNFFPGFNWRTIFFKHKAIDPILDSGNFHFFGSARKALFNSLSLLKQKGGTILVPSYHCGVEVEAVLQAGFKVQFYPLLKNLEIDLSWIRRNIAQDTMAILLIHYFGFPQPVNEVCDLCDQLNLVLIEDCAHSLYSCYDNRMLGTFGDVSIFSIMKTHGVPNGGGVLINNDLILKEKLKTAQKIPVTVSFIKQLVRLMLEYEMSIGELRAKMILFLLKIFYHNYYQDLTRPCPSEPIVFMEQPANFFQEGVPWITRFLLESGLNYDQIKKRRVRNFKILLENIHWDDHIRPLFRNCSDEICPLGLPVLVQNNDSLLDLLSKVQISAFIFGRFPHHVFDSTFTFFQNTEDFRKRLICLPVHQNLSKECTIDLAERVNRLKI